MLAKDSITIEYDSSVAILSFNRPQVLNAFDNELMESTISKVNELNKNELEKVLNLGAEKANLVAQEVLNRVREKLGYNKN